MTKNKPQIGLTRKLPHAVETHLDTQFNMRRNTDDTTMNSAQMVKFSQGLDGLLVTPADKVPLDVIDALPESIKIIATFSVGYDHIDIEAARNRSIIVTNTPGVLTEATADIALLLLLGAARGARGAEEAVRDDTWEGWRPTTFIGLDLAGKTLGIYGMGRIGQAVARRAEGFGMSIHYHNRRPASGVPSHYQYHDKLESLMKVSNFLSINCASTPETRGSINKTTLSLMPKSSVIINTARGDIIDDDDLIEALSTGGLFSAGLDVYAGEPDLDPRYRTLNNTFLLPHIGSGTIETRDNMGMKAAENLEIFFDGKTPPNAL